MIIRRGGGRCSLVDPEARFESVAKSTFASANFGREGDSIGEIGLSAGSRAVALALEESRDQITRIEL